MKKEVIDAKGKEIVALIRDIIKKGNVTRLVVKDQKGEILLDLPVSMLALGVFLSPVLAGLSVVLGLSTKCKIEIQKR
jgi:hypothetical protein